MNRSAWFLTIFAVVLFEVTGAVTLLMSLSSLGIPMHHASVTLLDPTLKPREWDFWTNEIDKLVKELKKEKENLDVRRKNLDSLAAHLESEKTELEKNRTDLERMRNEITEQLSRIEAAEKSNVRSLAKIYSAMKPAKAVLVLSEMEDSTIAKILHYMKSDRVGAIFQEMAVLPGDDKEKTLATRVARLSDQLRLIQEAERGLN